MTEIVRTSFRMNKETKDKLGIIADWQGHGNMSSVMESAINEYYMQLRAKRIVAGLPVDDPTPQEKPE